jgi:hypothetical protein
MHFVYSFYSMDVSRKLCAPKPIRHSSNKIGVKIITEFEKAEKPIRTPFSKASSNCLAIKALSDNLSYEAFTKDIRDSSCSSEIINIMNNESSGMDSLLYHSDILVNDFNDEFVSNDVIRTSMPPMRCKNPFFKNFSNNDKQLNYDSQERDDYKYFDDVNIAPK